MTFPTRWQVPSGYSIANDPDVFPVLSGQKFIANKSPKFPKTIIKTAASGREVRVQLASQPTWDFKVSYGSLTNSPPATADLQALQSFFLSRNGQAQPFFFFDPFDNAVTGQQIGVANGAATAFQLVRSVGAGSANAFVEVIYAVLGPVTVTVGATQMFGPALQNLLTYSQAIGGTNWAYPNATVVLNAASAPDGTMTATSISATAQYGGAYQNVSLAGSTSFTLSAWIWVPSGSRSIVLQIYDGTVYHSQAIAATTSPTRFSFTAISASSPSGANISFEDTATSGWSTFYVWGAQLEAGPVATAYDPTHTLAGDFTVGPYGVINFFTAPASGAIRWSGQFLFLCRFAQDDLDAQQKYQTLWSNNGLAFTSFHP